MRLQGGKTRGGWLGAFTLLVLCLAAAAQEPAAGDPLVVEQVTVSQRFREAERRLLEMTQGLKENDPARAAHLAEVVAHARREFVADGMSRIARLLEQERYTEAIELEEQVLDDLAALVDALSARQWTEDLERLAGLGRRLDDLVESQRRAEENLARAGESQDLAAALQEQEAIHRDTTELLGELDHAVEGSSAAAGQLRSASRAMEAAIRELEANRGKTALPHEENARRALEAARRAVRDAAATVVAERQRELLRRLMATLQETLARQEHITQQTAEVDRRVAGAQAPAREDLLAIGGLAERERELLPLMQQAQDALLREEGSGAVLAVLQSLAEDVGEVATQLDRLQTGRGTQELQLSVEQTLREAIAAFRSEQEWRASDAQPSGQETALSPEGEPALVHALAQLRLMRSLQVNVNRRTELLDASRGADGALAPEAGRELQRLTQRQAEVRVLAAEVLDSFGRPE